MADVVMVRSTMNWEALYIDGECVKQQHLNRIDVGRELVGYTVDSYRSVEQPMEELPKTESGYRPSSFPEKLEDVPNA